jgi:hypothetical protein
MPNPPIKLLDRVRKSIRLKEYSTRTEKTYVSWIRRGADPGKSHRGPAQTETLSAYAWFRSLRATGWGFRYVWFCR